jgi:hypothetical protein
VPVDGMHVARCDLPAATLIVGAGGDPGLCYMLHQHAASASMHSVQHGCDIAHPAPTVNGTNTRRRCGCGFALTDRSSASPVCSE